MVCPKCQSDNVVPTYVKGKYKCLECSTIFTAPKTQGMSEQKLFEKMRMEQGAKLY